jgi:hypothetical protein
MTEPDQNEIDKLDQRIDEAKDGLEAQTGEGDEQRFIDKGAADDDTVDDTIAPPG